MKQEAPAEKEADPLVLLRELASRWRAGRTLEYRSLAILNHAGEFRVQVRIHALLCRPNRARVVFLADNPEVSRIRVCDGLRICERSGPTLLRRGQTLQMTYAGRILADIPHPLDETGYSVDQFFSPTPFVPPPTWGDGKGQPKMTAVRLVRKTGDRYRLIFESGPARDTLILDASSFAPLEIVRVGDHAGQIQELLRERFDTVRLGANLPPELFRWTPADEAGDTLRV